MMMLMIPQLCVAGRYTVYSIQNVKGKEKKRKEKEKSYAKLKMK